MAAPLRVTGYQAWAIDARDEEEAACPAEAAEGLKPGAAAAAFTIVAAAVGLAAAPVLVALVAIFSPGGLDRVPAWLLGGAGAFFFVAAGRVPAAAILGLLLASRRSEA